MACTNCKKIRRIAVDDNSSHQQHYHSPEHHAPVQPNTPAIKSRRSVDRVQAHTGTNPLIDAHTLAFEDEIDSCERPEFRTFDQRIRPKRFADLQLPPAESPDIAFVRTKEFKDNLVDLTAAKVVKNLCKEEPEIKIPCPDCNRGEPCEKCSNPDASCSRETEGAPVSQCLLDAKFVRKMTLLGRVGRRMAKLFGEGVLWLDPDGTVTAKSWVPLKVQKLWHQWIKPNPMGAPVIGQPLPAPYRVVTDDDGNPYVQRGLAEEDSISVWNHEDQVFEERGVSDFPTCVRAKIPYSPRLELVGFEALGISADPQTLRCLRRLEGEGIIHFRRVETVPTNVCDCDTCQSSGQVQDYTTVAEFLPNPVPDCNVDCPYILAFVNGAPQWVQATNIECLRGPAGEAGGQGIQGIQGLQGDQGLRGIQGISGQDGRDGSNACC